MWDTVTEIDTETKLYHLIKKGEISTMKTGLPHSNVPCLSLLMSSVGQGSEKYKLLKSLAGVLNLGFQNGSLLPHRKRAFNSFNHSNVC